MDSKILESEAVARICRAHGISRLSLFGSRLEGTARPDRDVDLLVDFVPGRTPGLIGMIRLSYPPQDAPIPNSSRLSISAAYAFRFIGFSTTPNRPLAPAKSRFHSAWPGSDGSAGCRTRWTSGWRAIHSARRTPVSQWRARRTAIVRRPRLARFASSGPTVCPSS